MMSREEFEAMVAETDSQPEKRLTKNNSKRGRFTKTRKEQGRLEARQVGGPLSSEFEERRLMALDDYEDALCSKETPLLRVDFGNHGFSQEEVDRLSLEVFYLKVCRIHKRKGIRQDVEDCLSDCRQLWSTFTGEERLPYEKLALYRHTGSTTSLSSTFKLGEDEAYSKFMDLKEAAEGRTMSQLDQLLEEDFTSPATRNRDLPMLHNNGQHMGNFEADIDLDPYDLDEASTMEVQNDEEQMETDARDYEAMGDNGEELDDDFEE